MTTVQTLRRVAGIFSSRRELARTSDAVASRAAQGGQVRWRRLPAAADAKRSSRRLILAAVGLVLAAGVALPAAASAAEASPHWTIESLPTPFDFSSVDTPGCLMDREGFEFTVQIEVCDAYEVRVANVGAKPTAGPVVIEDTLPTAVSVQAVQLFWTAPRNGAIGAGEDLARAHCTLAPLRCQLPASFFAAEGQTVRPGQLLNLRIETTVNEPAVPATLTNEATVSGGGAEPASTTSQNTLLKGSPPFGLQSFLVPTVGLGGDLETQAGGHPFTLSTRLGLDTEVRSGPEEKGLPTSVADVRDILIDLPPGLAGSAVSTPATCTFAQLSGEGAGLEKHSGCPDESIVGSLRTEPEYTTSVQSPLYNMVPPHGVAAEFGYLDVLNTAHVLAISLVPTPQGYVLRTTSPEVPQITLTNIIADVFGDPAARDSGREPQATDVPTFTEPADCDGQPLITSVHLDSWQHPGTYNPDGSPNLAEPNWVTASSEAPPVSGCNKLAGLFKPTLTATPSTNQGDSPTGLEVDLKLPQQTGPETLATPPLKKAVVTLPEGMTVNPSSANGLAGCSLAQIGVSAAGIPNAAPPQCPDASKIGTVELETPALPGTLEGQIYVAKQTENPFGSLLALYIVVNDPKTGVVVKLPGEIKADPSSGQLTTVIDNSPQFPFTELRTKFFAGQKAALRTPAVCAPYKVTSQMTPWSAPESGPPATPAGTFKITQGCAENAAAEPNKPAFSAGTLNPTAGLYSPFVLKLSREDGSQELKGLNVALPPGLIGKLAGVGECSEAQIAAAKSREHEGGGAQEQASPSCPASSEVGTVTVGAGAGLTPYYTQGHAYLAGPYKGAPLSLATITPAVAGPYDLGNVVVRTALQVDPYTTQITAVSDEIPHILHGIPLDIRSVVLNMNKPNFTLNPTSCEKKSITGSLTSVLGGSAPLTNSFQVGGCKSLGFAPHLALSLKGGTKRNKNPALTATLTYPKGNYANIASAQVTLPHSAFLDQAHIGTVCTRVQFAAHACPAGSVYGKAIAYSPLLDKPLSGPVYLRSSSNKLPDLVADLNGQIEVTLDGKIDTGKGGGIRNTFTAVPDAPVSKFVLSLEGGKQGLLVNSENLCGPKAKTHAIADFTGQNGKVYNTTPKVQNSCNGKGKKHHKASKSQASRAVLSRLLGEW
jgi:hypothetical protein